MTLEILEESLPLFRRHTTEMAVEAKDLLGLALLKRRRGLRGGRTLGPRRKIPLRHSLSLPGLAHVEGGRERWVLPPPLLPPIRSPRTWRVEAGGGLQRTTGENTPLTGGGNLASL